MSSIYNFFKFLETRRNQKIPFRVKLFFAPNELTEEDLNVKSELDLSYSKITSLPNNLTVGRWLDLSFSKITSLPNNLTVCGDLDLMYTKITSLPGDLKVGGNLILSHTNIASLPDNLRVSRNIYVSLSKKEYFKTKFPKFTNKIIS